ncbi:MAG: ribonuclease D [Anaerolineaceae bacterium]|nr:ribonuclease D [Anaerolineaceae bacterium]
MVEHLSSSSRLAVDTESNSLFAYKERVCLIQFSVDSTDYLLDPFVFQDLSKLGPIFSDPQIEKVFHAGEYDLICMKRDYGFRFKGLFDTMIASRILGRQAIGLGSLLQEEFDVVLDKRYQRADWGLRPLPAAQLAYARLDSYYLMPLRDRLETMLIDAGRMELAREDFERLCATPVPTQDNNPDLCWRAASGQELSPRQLAVLQELCLFRDRIARSRDLPPFKIFGNQVMVNVARACPKDLEELGLVPEMHFKMVDKYGDGFLKAVQKGLIVDPPHRNHSKRMDDAVVVRTELLKAWRKEQGQLEKVESDVILPREVLETIAEQGPSKMEDLKICMQTVPYRYRVYGERILALLTKKEKP